MFLISGFARWKDGSDCVQFEDSSTYLISNLLEPHITRGHVSPFAGGPSEHAYPQLVIYPKELLRASYPSLGALGALGDKAPRQVIRSPVRLSDTLAETERLIKRTL